MQAQRAGLPEADSQVMFPQIWTWKEPGFTNICSDFLANSSALAAEHKTNTDLTKWPGYFEAGSAPSSLVVATVPCPAAEHRGSILAHTKLFCRMSSSWEDTMVLAFALVHAQVS